jgi:hypothetical protein
MVKIRLNSIGVRVSKEIKSFVWGILELIGQLVLLFDTTNATTPITIAHSKESRTPITIVSFFFFYLSSVNTRSNTGSGCGDLVTLICFWGGKSSRVAFYYSFGVFWLICS